MNFLQGQSWYWICEYRYSESIKGLEVAQYRYSKLNTDTQVEWEVQWWFSTGTQSPISVLKYDFSLFMQIFPPFEN